MLHLLTKQQKKLQLKNTKRLHACNNTKDITKRGFSTRKENKRNKCKIKARVKVNIKQFAHTNQNKHIHTQTHIQHLSTRHEKLLSMYL